MYRFLLRPAWLLFHAVVLAGIVLMVAAGFWQLNRLDERQDFNAQVRERSQQAPLELQAVLDEIEAGTLDPSTAEWLPVTTSGTYLPDQVVEFNNSQGGRAGDNVLSALVTDDAAPGATTDTTVIVNRGFIPLGIDVPAPPAVEVDIVGFIRPSEVRQRGELTDGDDGTPLTEIRRIDIPRLAEQFPGDRGPGVRPVDVVGPRNRPGRPIAGRASRTRQRTPPLLRHPVVHLCDLRRRRLGPRRATVAGGQGARAATSNRGFPVSS